MAERAVLTRLALAAPLLLAALITGRLLFIGLGLEYLLREQVRQDYGPIRLGLTTLGTMLIASCCKGARNVWRTGRLRRVDLALLVVPVSLLVFLLWPRQQTVRFELTFGESRPWQQDLLLVTLAVLTGLMAPHAAARWFRRADEDAMRRMRATRVVSLVLSATVVTFLAAEAALSDDPDTARVSFPRPEPTVVPTPRLMAAPVVTCRLVPAPVRMTNLRPQAMIPVTQGQPPLRSESNGSVRLRHPGNLVLSDGHLSAGDGYDAIYGSGSSLRVAPGRVSAPVTLAVWDTPKWGKRVAFVEVRLGPQRPVRWVEEPKLFIGTDGGDGGFADAKAASGEPSDDGFDGYIDASSRGEVGCATRLSTRGEINAVLFGTGIGDGGYVSFRGLDARDRVVSIVHDGGLLPWRYSGLPGKPPPPAPSLIEG